MIGHKLLVKNFKSLLDRGRLGHAYLFFGANRTGAKNFALALSSFVETGNFESESDPIRAKETLRALATSNGAGRKILNDRLLVEPNEKKTIGIDEARRIKSFLFMKPNAGLRRVVIVDRAEFLTTEAQNALLKITEEPPESALLILITREPELLRETLVSRFNKIFFAGVESLGESIQYLEEGKKFLALKPGERKDFIKNLLEPDDFEILNFLDAVILALASREKIDYTLWHKVLKLRENFANFPLNPKLQLTSLLATSQ